MFRSLAACGLLVIPVADAQNDVSALLTMTPIPAIQGTGTRSPLEGRRVSTRGVVTAVLPGLRGYMLQDDSGDGDPRTSDGLFVYVGAAPVDVVPGERVGVSGVVREYGGPPGEPSLTELADVSAPARLGRGTVQPVPMALPAGEEDLESFEGMLVRIETPMTLVDHHFAGRQGEVVIAAGGRLASPTQVADPGPAALALGRDNRRRRLVLTDGRALGPGAPRVSFEEAGLRLGDAVESLVGVLDAGRVRPGRPGPTGYRLHPVQPPVFRRLNTRPERPPEVGGEYRLAAFNVLNYFTTFGRRGAGGGCAPSGTAADCRGARGAAEFERQTARLVRALALLDADVVALMEIERNGGEATRRLVAALNAHLGVPLYAAVADPAEGVGGDAIQVALIHKPARIATLGPAFSDRDAVHHRAPVAQTFRTATGETFTVVGVHFKSRNCDGAIGAEADPGDGQGCHHARRTRQAAALLDFVVRAQELSASPDVVVLGDLNAHAREEPLRRLARGGLADQVARFAGRQPAYSHVFDGEAGVLDHALATASLARRLTGVAHWHINADEAPALDYRSVRGDHGTPSPFRSSDHDPLLVGLVSARGAGVAAWLPPAGAQAATRNGRIRSGHSLAILSPNLFLPTEPRWPASFPMAGRTCPWQGPLSAKSRR